MVISVKRCNPETEMILNKLSITKNVKDVTKIRSTQNKISISHSNCRSSYNNRLFYMVPE